MSFRERISGISREPRLQQANDHGTGRYPVVADDCTRVYFRSSCRANGIREKKKKKKNTHTKKGANEVSRKDDDSEEENCCARWERSEETTIMWYTRVLRELIVRYPRIVSLSREICMRIARPGTLFHRLSANAAFLVLHATLRPEYEMRLWCWIL